MMQNETFQPEICFLLPMKHFMTICCFVLVLVIFVPSNSFAQKTPKAKDVLLFEISKYTNPGGYRGPSYSKNILFIYQSGRVACKSTSHDPHGKKIETVKNKCFQLNKEKITELTELAEQTDFLEAENSYKFFNGGVDYGKSFSIIFYGKSVEKAIHLTNQRQSQNDIPLPESVTLFLKKIAEIDATMEVKYELGEESKRELPILQ